MDFYSPELKIALEIDGDTHFKDNEIKYDSKRQTLLENYGIKFLRFTNTDVLKSTDYVIDKLREFVRKC